MSTLDLSIGFLGVAILVACLIASVRQLRSAKRASVSGTAWTPLSRGDLALILLGVSALGLVFLVRDSIVLTPYVLAFIVLLQAAAVRRAASKDR